MATMKTDGGKQYTAAAYAYVPDPESPSTWKLRLWEDPEKKVTPAQLGRAVAALSPGGFRGNTVEIPAKDLPAVKAKIRAAYVAAGVKAADIPERVQEGVLTLEAKAQMIRSAYLEQAEGSLPPGVEAMSCGIDVLDDSIVVHDADEGQLYQIPYTLQGDQVTFGTPQAVQVQLAPVSEAVDFSAMTKPEGKEWEVSIVKPGLSKNGFYYDRRVLEAAAPLFQGAPVNAYELLPARYGHVSDAFVDQKPKLAKNLVGRVTETWNAPDGAIKGRLPLLGAEWLRSKLMEAWTRGVEGLGLSHDSVVSWIPGTIEGRQAKVVTKFGRVDSVDVVTAPSAGGRFERAVAGSAGPQEESGMKELLEKLRQVRPDLATALGDNPSTERVIEAITGALKDAPTIRTAQSDEVKELRQLLEQGRQQNCAALLNTRVSEAKLPEPSAKQLLKRFTGRAFEAAELELAITEKKEELDALTKSGAVKVGDEGKRVVESLVDRRDKLQAAMDKLAGLPAPDPAHAADGIFDGRAAEGAVVLAKATAAAYPGTPAFRGIRDAYLQLGGDLEHFGRLREEVRVTEEYNSATFSYVLGNTLHRRLVTDYAAPDYGEDLVISFKRPAADFKTQESVRIGYFGDLDNVNPETADYTDITAQADEEATFSVGQKGNLLTITRRTIINDDIGVIRRLPERLGRAARRTHARYVWTFFTDNAAIYDSIAFFIAGHGNLGSTALSVTAVQALLTAMRKQTEPGSSERIAFQGPFNLFVPPDLEWTANYCFKPGPAGDEKTRQDTSLMGVVIPHVNPLFTDTTDYVLTAPVGEIDIIEMAYLNGREVPEVFLADQPTVGQMFIADKLQYKIRHEYGGAVVDYRGAQKAVVAG